MADQQTRIHPVAPPPQPPSRPKVSFKSHLPPVPPTLANHLHLQLQRPSPLIQPFANSKTPTWRSCWCRCLCWTIAIIVLLLIALGLTAAVIYAVFHPKVPNYSVDNLRISDLRLNFDLSLYARFNVRVTAYNPNNKIGIYYESGSQLSVWYKTTKLCQGPIPNFYQGHHNKTVLDVALTGQSQYGNTLLAALQEQQQTGMIPLDLNIHVPVRIKLGRLKMKKVKILGNCKLIVDSLSTNSLISIKTSTCNFKVKL